MVSQRQIEANRKNAKLGGVKTPEGKRISSLNAVKHGVLMKILTKEESKEATVLQEKLFNDCQPQSTIEQILIERIAVWYVRLKRAVRAEKEQMMKIFNPRITKRVGGFQIDDEALIGKEVVVNEGYSPKVTDEDIELLERTYLRYETIIERNFYRALHELQRIQATRPDGKPPTP